MNESDPPPRRENLARGLSNSAREIALYLAAAQRPDGQFPAREFYGKAFSAFLWSRWPDEFETESQAVLTAIAGDAKLIRGAGKYHFEFNRYALLHMNIPVSKIDGILGGEKYARTRVANWTLLRAACRLKSRNPIQRFVGKLEAAFVLLYFRTRDQLIEDQRGAFTAQYHCLCVALLFEIDDIWLRGRSRWLNKVLAGAADTICRITMPNGECNYLGRGKFQSFGYGAAVLALCRAYKSFGIPIYLETAGRIFDHVQSFKRDDGSLPLVLSPTGRQEGPPETADTSKPGYAGWYSYNNYYDYLPFVGALFFIAAEELNATDSDESGSATPSVPTPLIKTDLLSDILLVDRTLYRAVVSLPNDTWAASQPLPFIGLPVGCPLPAFGGENLGRGPHSAFDIPVPVMHCKDNSPDGLTVLCDMGSYAWGAPDRMRGTWKEGRHERQFIWDDNGYLVRDTVQNTGTLCWSCEIIRLPLPLDAGALEEGVLQVRNALEISSTEPIIKFDTPVFGADGPMDVFGVACPLRSGALIEIETRFKLV